MDPVTGAALITAGSNLFSSLFSAKSAKDTNRANIDQAQKEMDFQERMSNTAHQREVADLRAAGLNPLLSINAGASSPNGAMATLENPYKDLPNNVANSARSFMEMKMGNAAIKTQESQAALNSASAAKIVAETPRNSLTGKISQKILEGLGYLARPIASAAQAAGRGSARLEMALAHKG